MRKQLAARSVPSRVPNMFRLLPFHRPASPEMKLSPRATMAVVPEVGPACEVRAPELTKAISAATNTTASASGRRPRTPPNVTGICLLLPLPAR